MPQHPLGQLSPEDFIHRLEILRREAVHTKSGYTISFIFPSPRTFHVVASCSDCTLPDPNTFLPLLLRVASSLDECNGAVIPQP